MARQVQKVYHGYERLDVWITVGDTELHGEIRARAWDPDPHTNEDSPWWAMCDVHYAPGDTRLDWFPWTRVRPNLDEIETLDDFQRTHPASVEGDDIRSTVIPLPQRDA